MTINVRELRKMLEHLPDNAQLKVKLGGDERLVEPKNFFLEKKGYEFLIVDVTRREDSDPTLQDIESRELDVQFFGESEDQNRRWRIYQSLHCTRSSNDLHEGYGATIAEALAAFIHAAAVA